MPTLSPMSGFRRNPHGFALVVTLSLMILLIVIAVGLLTLSSVSLRSSSQMKAMNEARQNARLAMVMAIGQLQSLAGQDTRVTANSEMFSTSGVTATGVWRSWEGSDHDSTGKAIIPDYSTKRAAGDPTASPAGASQARFLGWLTSTADSTTSPSLTSIPNSATTTTTGYVKLVSTKSLATSDRREIYLKPTLVNNSLGAVAWWTSGDNSKAMINTDHGTKPSTVVEWQERGRANGRMDAKSFSLESLDTTAAGKVIPTTASLKLVNQTAETKQIHDLTANSRGLLTNTATGGWRRDLSLLSEKYSGLPATGLPCFTVTPGTEKSFYKAVASDPGAGQLLYPWAPYRQIGASNKAWQWVPPICSWSALVDYTQQYRGLTSSSALSTVMSPAIGSLGANDRTQFQDKVRRSLQVARIQWIYSIGSRKVVSGTTITYNPGILITPVVTLWNPYNVKLTVSNFSINIKQAAPVSFTLSVGSTVLPVVSLRQISSTSPSGSDIKLTVNSITMDPGASRIFSVASSTPTINESATNITLTPGYRPGGGILYTYLIVDPANPTTLRKEVKAAATDLFKVVKFGYDGEKSNKGNAYVGMFYDVTMNGVQGLSAGRMDYDAVDLGSGVIDALYPPLTRTVSASMEQIDVSKTTGGSISTQPIASTLLGYRMASMFSKNPSLGHLNSKGMLQANPLTQYAEVGYADDNSAVTTMAGTGVYHPVNAPYDFAFEELYGWNDTVAPQWDTSTGSSYIVSGLTSGDGLTRCVMAELPTRPIQSLADLQHFDVRNNNPIPPFQYNIIGNGSAHPLFSPTSIANASSINDGMCNDDAYLLNHLLFDDWFVSSIQPDLNDFKTTENTSILNVYKNHLTLADTLPNRFYRPAPGADTVDGTVDPDKAATKAMSTTKDSVTGKYSYETIASKLVVDGMFNVNSVSLKAWKALLRQSRDQQVPYLDASGRTDKVTASSDTYPYSRTSIAGDQASNSSSIISGKFSGAAAHAGIPLLTDAQVDELAQQIVTEIKARGPFLSLSEFVNRQLSSTKDLAIASTIQKALDNLANMGSNSKNPFATIQATAPVVVIPPGKTDYKFTEAAQGSSAFGMPGWIRQADILKPLAPILSARDDTFTIRAYGDSRTTAGIVATAWCEVVVQREAGYVDKTDDAAIAPNSAAMSSAVNKRFGRRFEVISFRWLDPSEV